MPPTHQGGSAPPDPLAVPLNNGFPQTAGPDLSRFSNRGYQRGAGRLKELLWLLSRGLFFRGLPLNALRRFLLRSFGAHVGKGAVIKPGVKVTFPWRLTLGDHVWLGEEVFILNLAPVTIGNHVCISQRAFLCTGSHDWSDPYFGLVTKPITIHDGVWICAGAFVGPGVTIGRNAVATAGSVVTHDLPEGMICGGNPCVPLKPRVFRRP
jgi:putative colanic acid biosynthesis acetyltransferase WcaF